MANCRLTGKRVSCRLISPPTSMDTSWALICAASFLASSLSAAASASGEPQQSISGYQKPPASILKILHTPEPPAVVLSPDGRFIVLATLEAHPPLKRILEPFHKLAGTRINPKNYSKIDTPGGYGFKPCVTKFEIVTVQSPSAPSKVVEIPDACMSGPLFSADGSHFAFTQTTATAVQAWVGDSQTGRVHPIKNIKLNSTLGHSLQWMPDQKSLLVKLVPQGVGSPPEKPETPAGPFVEESLGVGGSSSTYEARDTLKSAYEESLFSYYMTSQIGIVPLDTEKVRTIGKPDLYLTAESAPSGKLLLVTRLTRPFSSLVTYERFPMKVEIWDSKGAVVQTVATIPLADRVPIRGVRKGPRDFQWHSLSDSLFWVEALDDGDWNKAAEYRDQIVRWKAPFDQAPDAYGRVKQRLGDLDWAEDGSFALLSEYDLNRHWTQSTLLNAETPEKNPTLLWEHSLDEHYAHPGSPLPKLLPSGASVVRKIGDSIFLSGAGSTPDGDRPFFDEFNIKTKKRTRWFRSDRKAFEQFLFLTNPSKREFLTWFQTPQDPPNARLNRAFGPVKTLKEGEGEFELETTTITHLPDPVPEFHTIQKRLVSYKRKDGVDLSSTLYLPPNTQPGARLPTILYAYPLDYAEKSTAGQVTGSPMTFSWLRKYQLLVLEGYALLDNTAFPIVGDPKTAYNSYLEQLKANAEAAIAKAVELGVTDPNRVGVTGHSHGALMTVNLLAHTSLFKAGVASSGSYNKTMTAFGFQSERRTVWEAPEVYRQVSPFFFAPQIKTPLLLMHGEEDANPGTTPLQTRLLYQAVKAHGGIVRQVLLPGEPHWYTAIESKEQMLYEMVRWFGKYVKGE